MAQCPGCNTQAFLECTCPPGQALALGEHRPSCSHYNVDSHVVCPPDSDQCCQAGHDHAAAANSCTADHSSEPCPEPKSCRTWRSAIADARHPLFEPGSHPLFSGQDIPDCPGGHCHKDLDSCAGCRPLHIVMLPGTQVTLAGQAG